MNKDVIYLDPSLENAKLLDKENKRHMQWKKVSESPPKFGSYNPCKKVMFASEKGAVWYGQVDNLGHNNSLRWFIIEGPKVFDIPKSFNNQIVWWFEIEPLPKE